MVRLADGDRAAFDPLFDALWPSVRRFAERALGSAADAEDAAQTAMLKVFERAAVFDVDRDAVAWIFGIVAFECATVRKQRVRRREDDASVAIEGFAGDVNLEQAAITRDLENALVAVVGTLKPEDHQTITAVLAGQREKIELFVKDLPSGDMRRGQAVFHGLKVSCVSCHKIGYVGGQVGPDMSKIGSIRSDRDLLESILLPSASFVRSYEPVQVTTSSGKLISGILKKDAVDEVILTINATDEVRINRADIEEVTPGTVSVMPSGLDQQLTRQELADLIAFLRACR